MRSGTISALACPCTPSPATSGLQRETGQSFSRKSNYKSLASAELVLLRTWKFSRVCTNSKRVQGTLRGSSGGTASSSSKAQEQRRDAATLFTAKRILEKLGIQTSSSFVKLSQVCIPEFKAIFLIFGVYMACFFFLSINYWSQVDHDLMASI